MRARPLKYLLFPFHIAYKIYVGIVFWTTLLLLYPLFYTLLSKRKFRKVFRWKQYWSRAFQVLLFTPVRISRRGNLPAPPFIICSNHSSYLDIVLFYSAFDDYFLFMGKGELLRWPLFRIFFSKMDIPVHRGKPFKAVEAFHRAAEEINKGNCIAIFPEGTIPFQAPRLGPFKSGAFKLAIQTGVPIVPVTWVSNYKRFGEPSDWLSGGHPGVAHVIIHPPVYPGKKDPSSEFLTLRKEVFQIIDSGLPEEFQTTTR